MIFPVLLHILGTLHAAQATPAQKPKIDSHQASKVSKSSPETKDYLPPAPLPSSVLARVNGVPIKAEEVNKLLWDWAGRGVLEDLILFQLIRDRAAMDKISVAPAEVQVAFENQLAEIQKQVPPGQEIEAFIREKGFPKSRLYLHIQADLLMTRIVDLKFKPQDYISVSTLVVTPKSKSPADTQEAVGKAHDIYMRLKKGEDWDAVFKSTDQPPQSAQTHGVLGWRAIDAFPPATKAEMRALKVHEFTNPVETTNGIQIFRIDDYGLNAKPGDLAGLKKQYEDRAKASLAQDLQKTAKIDRVFGKVAEKSAAPKKPQLAKLGIVDTKVGAGDAVGSGDEVWVRYTGKFTDGKTFDSNDKPGAEPFHFMVGMGMVIKGWDQGLVGMKKGGKRKLSIPYSLGYGERGTPGIPPMSDLIFDVELINLQKKK